jgi:KEOPS complex subunit Cgi121
MEVLEGVLTVDDLDAFVARLGAIGDDHGVSIQAFDARYIVDRAHLETAVELADRAFERDENVADDRAVEILLYAAGRRQINRALELGVDRGGCPAVLVVSETPRVSNGASGERSEPRGNESGAVETLRSMPAFEPAETLGEYDEQRVREWFDIGDAELATGAGLADLVHERVALLVVEK